MMTRKEKVIDIILKVTEVGQEYSTAQIESRVFDFKGETIKTQVKQIPHTNAFPQYIKASKAFSKRATRSGMVWKRNELRTSP